MVFWSSAHQKQKKAEGVTRRSNEQALAQQRAAAASLVAEKAQKDKSRRTQAGKRSKTIHTRALGLSEQERSGITLKHLTGE